jgi:hypothetical protein
MPLEDPRFAAAVRVAKRALAERIAKRALAEAITVAAAEKRALTDTAALISDTSPDLHRCGPKMSDSPNNGRNGSVCIDIPFTPPQHR